MSFVKGVIYFSVKDHLHLSHLQSPERFLEIFVCTLYDKKWLYIT